MKKRLSKEEKCEQMINEVLDNFNFKKCRKVMEFLDWTWAGANGVPTIENIKQTAKYLMEGAINGCLEDKRALPNETYFHETGGLRAEAIKNKYNQLIHVKLSFVLDDWESDGD